MQHSISNMFRNRLYNSSGRNPSGEDPSSIGFTERRKVQIDRGNVMNHTGGSLIPPSVEFNVAVATKSPTASNGR